MAKINERFILILNTFFKRNVSEMARQTGISQPTLNNIVANRLNSPSAENIEKLLSSMENISAEWLLRGEGDMEKSNQHLENVKNSVAIGRDANGSEIHITCQDLENFMKITKKYQEQTDRMLTILEKTINK